MVGLWSVPWNRSTHICWSRRRMITILGYNGEKPIATSITCEVSSRLGVRASRRLKPRPPPFVENMAEITALEWKRNFYSEIVFVHFNDYFFRSTGPIHCNSNPNIWNWPNIKVYTDVKCARALSEGIGSTLLHCTCSRAGTRGCRRLQFCTEAYKWFL